MLKIINRFMIVLFILSSFAAKATQIYGHRGAAGLSPENTLRGYKTALSIGVDAIDMDIGMTKDGVIVLNHDPYLNPDFTRNHEEKWLTHPIHLIDIPFRELKVYKVGKVRPHSRYQQQFPLQRSVQNEPIAKLQNIFDFLNRHHLDDIKVQIEIKTHANPKSRTAHPNALVPKLVQILQATPIKNPIEIHSFDWRNLILLQQMVPQITTSYLTDNQDSDINEFLTEMHAGHQHTLQDAAYPTLIKALGGKIWCPSYEDLTEQELALAHALGLKVNVWTVDHPEGMDKMLDWNVDGIITNRPDILRGLMAARGMNVPEPKRFT